MKSHRHEHANEPELLLQLNLYIQKCFICASIICVRFICRRFRWINMNLHVGLRSSRNLAGAWNAQTKKSSEKHRKKRKLEENVVLLIAFSRVADDQYFSVPLDHAKCLSFSCSGRCARYISHNYRLLFRCSLHCTEFPRPHRKSRRVIPFRL